VVPRCEVTIVEGASTDARDYHVSFAKVRERLPEFEPSWNVERGIRELYEAYTRIGLDFERFEGREFTRLKQIQHLIATHAVGTDLMWTAGKAI
jgi:hypothetical protein